MRPVRVQQYARRRVRPRVRRFRQPDIPAFHVVTGATPLGHIRARRDMPFCTRATRMFGIDRLLGDDEFVFLSVGQPMATAGIEEETCFLFDAEELVREGALVRQGDILNTFEFGTFEGAIENAQRTAEAEMLELQDMDEDDLTLSEKQRLEELEAYAFQEGVTDMMEDHLRWYIRNYGSVREAWDDLRITHDRMTLRGKEAIQWLMTCSEDPQPRCEILVPRRLPLAKALLVGRPKAVMHRARIGRRP